MRFINQLIIDIENWMLEESGLLAKFNTDKRAETIKKSTECIERSEAYISAIDIIEKGEQSDFLNETMSKLRKSMYLRNRKRVFSILYNFVTLQPDFIKDNLKLLSELIDFTSNEITDTYTLERIVSSLSQYIYNEKKLVNKQLHYFRNKELDKRIFSNLVIGIGTLINFCLSKEGETGLNIYIERTQKQLFPSLCKYLSYMTSREKALSLINKAVIASLSGKGLYRINGTTLRSVTEDAEKLVDYIINLKIEVAEEKLISYQEDVYCQYLNRQLSITYLPYRLNKMAVNTAVKNVYNIPGTFLNVASLIDEKWDYSDSIIYYKNKWKNLLTISEEQILEQDNSEKVKIVVKAINPDYKTFVFCTRLDSILKEDGIVHVKGYSPMYKVDDMCDIFDVGMIFEAEISNRNDGKVTYSITNNIREFSRVVAKESDENTIGLCLNYDVYKHEAIFITENGALCIASVDNAIKIGDCFVLSLDIWEDESSYPIATILDRCNIELDRRNLLKSQLKQLSLYNESNCDIIKESLHPHGLPYMLLIIDNYLRVFDDKIIKYNLYQIARLFAILEKSSLADYYASCIQYMESTECFIENIPISFSINKLMERELVESQFPSLRSHFQLHNLMYNFGSENDLEYLYKLAVNTSDNEQVCKLAKLSLAASLIESISDDERPISYLRGIAIESLGGNTGTSTALEFSSSEIEKEDAEEEQNYCPNFGLENQTQEFKTSIVFLAGDFDHKQNSEEQLYVIMKVICGFLNAKGGTLFIGVSDDGESKGIEADLRALNCNLDKYQRIIREKIVREFSKDVNSTINISFIQTEAKHTICKIEIPQYYTPISLKNGEFYQRQGNETRIIKGSDLVLFIQRKIQGKDVILVDENASCKEDNAIVSDDDLCVSIASGNNNQQYKIFNKDDFYIHFYENGSYQITEERQSNNNSVSLRIASENKNHYILQCYSNGCVNKVPVKNLYNLQVGYKYKNGLNRNAELRQLIILSDNDYIIISCRQNNMSYMKIFPVAEISAHTALGLKGNQLLSQTFDYLEDIYYLKEKDKKNVERLISHTKSNLGYNMASVSYKNEVDWIKEHIIKKERLYVIRHNDSETEAEKVVAFAKTYDEKGLEAFIMSYLKEGRIIPRIREIVKEALINCHDKESFWFIISVCFNCDITSFRKPIAELIKDSQYFQKPDVFRLPRIVKQLFTFDHKYSQSVDFIYPLKDYLSDESIEYIRETTTGLSTPEYYNMFIDLTRMTKEESFLYLLKENSVPSFYAIYNLLEIDREENDCIAALKNIPSNSIHSKLLKDLVSVALLNKKSVFFSRVQIDEIQKNGYSAFYDICIAKSNRDKVKNEVENIEEYNGKVVRAKVIQDYKHYYLLQINSLLIILQHSWSVQKHYIGDIITVKIVSTHKKQRTMFATELDDIHSLPEQEPLLAVGEEIEVKISAYNGKYVPSVRNAFSRIDTKIISYPPDFDFKYPYKAIVVRKKNLFEYDIRLTEKVKRSIIER